MSVNQTKIDDGSPSTYNLADPESNAIKSCEDGTYDRAQESPQDAATQKKSTRLTSLDALRGLNMLFIAGLATLIVQLCDRWPGPISDAIALQMTHVDWNGIRHHDTIFPLFLFLAGVSFPFSLAKRREKGASYWAICGKILWRGFALVALGIIYSNKVNFDYANWRYMGVLQHIGLAWMFAAFLYLITNRRMQIAISVAILVGYWLTCALVPAPDANPPEAFTKAAFMERAKNLLTPEKSESIQKNFSMAGGVVGYVDRCCVPGRLYTKIGALSEEERGYFADLERIEKKGVHDPEGLASTLPAIVTALLGMIFGTVLMANPKEKSGYEKVVKLIVWGLILAGVGLLWNEVFPINKKIWNSSFVCFVGGLSAVALGVFYLVIDVWKFRWWAFPFVVVGMNSITIYLAQRIINFSNARDFFFGDAVSRFLPEEWQAVGTTCAGIVVAWTFLFWLYKRRIFMRV